MHDHVVEVQRYLPATTFCWRYTYSDPRAWGSNDSQICCRLIPANLDCGPQYRALSYEWDSIDNTKIITINGKEGFVRQNLRSALWHLRKDTGDYSAPRGFWSAIWNPTKDAKGESLWIDALCINKDDEIERGKQVSMMGSIYRNAEVNCWLREGDGNTTHVMERLKALSDAMIKSPAAQLAQLASNWKEMTDVEPAS